MSHSLIMEGWKTKKYGHISIAETSITVMIRINVCVRNGIKHVDWEVQGACPWQADRAQRVSCHS